MGLFLHLAFLCVLNLGRVHCKMTRALHTERRRVMTHPYMPMNDPTSKGWSRWTLISTYTRSGTHSGSVTISGLS
ncbi:hypothetical protein EDB89DRAFT_1934923 [Lactarius sanguifluus]|nr:hypothetical protein EDB89DRAFT_1934923 [Lactarius sanguifluus]